MAVITDPSKTGIDAPGYVQYLAPGTPTSQISAVIADLSAAGGGTVQLGAGVYPYDTSIVPAAGVTLRGVGPQTTWTTAAPGSGFALTGGTIIQGGATLAAAQADGAVAIAYNTANQSSPTGDTLVPNFWVKNIGFQYWNSVVNAGAQNRSSFWGGGMRNVSFDGCADTAIQVTNFQEWSLEHILMYNVAQGVHAKNWHGGYSGGNSSWNDIYVANILGGGFYSGITLPMPKYGIKLEAVSTNGRSFALNAISGRRCQVNAYGGGFIIPDSAGMLLVGDGIAQVVQMDFSDLDLEGNLCYGILLNDHVQECRLGYRANGMATGVHIKTRTACSYNTFIGSDSGLAFEIDALFTADSATVSSGGTGYAVGDYIVLSGGTFSQPAAWQVTAVNAGVVTGISLVAPGGYSASPASLTATTTSGSGTGCTLAVTAGSESGSVPCMGEGSFGSPTVASRNKLFGFNWQHTQAVFNPTGSSTINAPFNTTTNTLPIAVAGIPQDFGAATFTVYTQSTVGNGVIRFASNSAQTATMAYTVAQYAGNEFQFSLNNSATTGTTYTVNDSTGAVIDTLVVGTNSFLWVKSDGVKWRTLLKI